MRDLVFVQAAPDDDYYLWQTHLWLDSLKSIGKSNKAISLIFTPNFRQFNTKWKELEKLFPESEFFYYKDTDNISKLLGFYIPLLRPYILMKYWQFKPEMKNKAVFYCDADIVFTENFNVDQYIEDDICYVSNTLSYINSDYFDSKIKDVLPDKIEDYKKIDVLDDTCKLVGVSREIAVKNKMHSGGAQYLIKNIDSAFWDKVLTDCIKIKTHLMDINKNYFQSENKGFQSWCCDMFSVLWNLWLLEKEVKIVKEMDFAWSSDPIKRVSEVGILHNAGIVSETQGDIPVFYKGKYHQGNNPLYDPKLKELYNNEKTKTLANWYYISKLIDLTKKYEINY